MKKLEELGISPSPWKIGSDSGGWIIVKDAKGIYSAIPDGDEETEAIANAHLIAAAPELYYALQSLVEYIDRECIPCCETACELMYYAHNALAKASGESEVADER